MNINNGDDSLKLMGKMISMEPASDLGNSKAIAIVNSCAESSTNNKVAKSSEKRPSNNNFPANVRILLSTRIFDGVPVIYSTWKRDTKLRGVIQGNGFMCHCMECNSTKIINASEFERHAGSHFHEPNKHIYFQNGISVYEVATKLRNTPNEMLFEVIHKITGSPINQQNFRILERIIYGCKPGISTHPWT